jgi:putative membrane protein
MLYSDHPFGLAQFLVDPLVVGVLAGLASTLWPRLVRALTPAAYRRRAVETAARATFYERGVHHTAGRSGVLVYIALTEQMVEVVADDGVIRSVEPDGWKKACAVIDGAVARGGEATAKALAELAPILAIALPRHVEDVNELPDAIDEGGRA